jgi:hypothetical protein
MFKIIAFFMIKLFARLFVGIDILLSCRKHLDDRFISLRMEVWVHKASLSPNMFFIEVSLPSWGKWIMYQGI